MLGFGIGPAGKLLSLMDRHPFRPAHIHIIVSLYPLRVMNLYSQANIFAQATKEGYRPLTTQIFDRKDKYLDNDSVFAVKDSLVVDFVPRKDDPKAALELQYDVKLVADTKASSA
jgi:catechol 1,2-dioxygenase